MIAVIERDDDAAVCKIQTIEADQRGQDRIAAFADVLRAVFVRVAAVVGKIDISDGLAIVTKQHPASLAYAFANFRIALAAWRIDLIGKNLISFRNALVRHTG